MLLMNGRTATITNVLVGATMLLMTGCSVALHSQSLDAPPHKFSDTIQAQRKAEGLSESKVGWGRGTVFYIPIVPIYMTGDDNEEVMRQVRSALENVGYQVSLVDSAGAANGPVVTCKVDNFWFNNYTWIFPFVPTWGNIKLTASVQRDGRSVWNRSFSAGGFSANFFNGYTSAANGAMKKILDEMVQAFASEEFHHAVSAT